jgi:hypothetical protein
VLANFPLTQVDQVIRRTLYAAAVVGAIGIGLAVGIGEPLAIPGVVVGMVLAVANHRTFQATAMRFTTDEGTLARKPFAGTVFLRLGACTGIAVLALVLVPPMGWGIVGALAVFQFILLLNSVVALVHYQRQEVPGDA